MNLLPGGEAFGPGPEANNRCLLGTSSLLKNPMNSPMQEVGRQLIERDRVVCEAKRTGSRLLTPWPPGTPPGLSTTTRHEGSDSPYAINTATVQPCRIDRPGSPPAHSPPSRQRPSDPRGQAQGKTLIPNPRPLNPATFMVRLCSLAEQIRPGSPRHMAPCASRAGSWGFSTAC
jgi:hypothetical protein